MITTMIHFLNEEIFCGCSAGSRKTSVGSRIVEAVGSVVSTLTSLTSWSSVAEEVADIALNNDAIKGFTNHGGRWRRAG
jgi:hypothetical protein